MTRGSRAFNMPIIHGSFNNFASYDWVGTSVSNYNNLIFFIPNYFTITLLYGTFSALLQHYNPRKKHKSQIRKTPSKFKKENSLRFGCFGRSNCKIEREVFCYVGKGRYMFTDILSRIFFWDVTWGAFAKLRGLWSLLCGEKNWRAVSKWWQLRWMKKSGCMWWFCKIIEGVRNKWIWKHFETRKVWLTDK